MAKPQLPEKPSPDFPLFPHRNGQWAKCVGPRNQRKMLYFGPWADPEGALRRYQEFLVENGKPVTPKKPRTPKKRRKPKPPYKGFPLFAHSNGQWAKTIDYKTRYFGAWDDPEGAVRRWQAEKANLLEGRRSVPRDSKETTIGQVCDAFMNSKRTRHAAGELSPQTVMGYQIDCERLTDHFGKGRIVETLTPFDFESYRNALAKGGAQPGRKGRSTRRRPLGPVAIGKAIMAVRTIFKYAYEQDMISAPMKYGQNFKKPSPKVLREARNKKGKRMFSQADIVAMLDLAKGAIKPMIWLGINCGLGNTDCARLQFQNIDLERQWLDYPRPKTGVVRWSPLWPETCAAITEYLRKRPEAANESDRDVVFLTQRTAIPWENTKGYDPVGNAISRILRTMKIDQHGLGFYALRHTFLTVGEGCQDQKAVEFIMGHAPDARDMSARYREEFSEERLLHVTNFVHDWLFSETIQEVVPDELELPTDSIAVA